MFRKIYFILISGITSVFIWGVVVAETKFSNKENNFNIQSQCKKSTDFLFIISAKKGEITKVYSDNQYKLIVNKSDFHEPVIGFSDRSVRVARHLSMLQLIKKWERKGQDSFKYVPPNGSLSADNIKGLVITLNKRPYFDQGSQNYVFSYTAREGIIVKKLNHITMTIDAFNLECVYDEEN